MAEIRSSAKGIGSVKFITITAILTAIAVVLQYLEFPVPIFIPSFVKFDFSDMPAILAAFLVSPVSGVCVCLLKNVIHIAVSQSAGVGELCNFLLGVCMVLPAWFIYKINPSKGMALAAMIAGAAFAAVASIFLNFYITYPFYQENGTLTISNYKGKAIKTDGTITYNGGTQKFDTSDTSSSTGIATLKYMPTNELTEYYDLTGRRIEGIKSNGITIVKSNGKSYKVISQ